MRAGLAAVSPVAQRMRSDGEREGSVLGDDTYNANPASMLAALEAVRAASSGNPFVAILGEMFELGPESPLLHFEVGKAFGAAKPARLIALGPLGLKMLKGAQAAGLAEAHCFHAQGHAEAADYVRRFAPAGRGSWLKAPVE